MLLKKNCMFVMPVYKQVTKQEVREKVVAIYAERRNMARRWEARGDEVTAAQEGRCTAMHVTL